MDKTQIQEWTEKTIEFIVSGRTDFESIKPNDMEYSTFNDRVIGYISTNDFVLLDLGGGSGERIALPVKKRSSGAVYVVDPGVPGTLYSQLDNVVNKFFRKDLGFLKEGDKNKPLAFVSLRTNFDVCYDVVETALQNEQAFFVALEPLYIEHKPVNFPFSDFVAKYNKQLKKAMSEFGEPCIFSDLDKRRRFSGFKQLYVCDMANALQENGFDVDIFYTKTKRMIAPDDSEHVLVARKA